MKNIFLLLFIAVTTFSYGQNSLNGQVKDESTNQPVVGATVYISKLDIGTITDLDGEFSFQGISNGTYNLLVSSLGYSSRTRSIVVPSKEALEIILSPSAIEMEEIIISTPFHQLQSENVMKVERATLEEISRTGAINLAEGLTQIAGVESITTGTGIGKPVIRGLSSNRVLVYTQGVRFENQQFGDEHGLGISDSGVESVEVIKGPASLLYGSDALGGVLYLNPERYAPVRTSQLDAGFTYNTNTEGIRTNAGFKASSNKLKFLLRGNYEVHSDYKTGNEQRVTNSRFDEWDLKTGVGFRSGDYHGDLRYNLNASKTGIPEEIGLQSTSKDVLEPYQQVQNHVLSLDNKFYFDNSSLDVKLGYLFNDRKEFEDHHEHEHEHETDHEHGEEEEHDEEEVHEEHGEEAALDTHLETINYDAKYHFPRMGDFETIVGVQGMFQNNKNFGEEILIPDASIRDFGILATTHYHLDNLDIQAGIRYDNRSIDSESFGETGHEGFIPAVDRKFNSFNGAFGVKYDFSPAFVTRINLATGFRAPNLAELTSNGSHHGTNRYEIGNASLKNEQNYQLDLALEYRNEHFEVFTNAFYNNISNYIYLNPTGEIIDDNNVFEYVQNNAEMYGGEAGLHIHPHPLDWLHIESTYELVIGKQENGNYLPLIPAQSILNTLRFELGDQKWLSESYSFISLKSIFEQNRTSIFETETAGYSLLSAGFGTSFSIDTTEVQLRVSGKNLLNETYISHLSRLKTDEIPNMGRNVSLGVKVIL
ncbi:TonB-dependent receptor [Salinimicrobium marinum]|uniref:TonB-dependent receptor n=1 Tax=Salinimicrobium marinum TaxID=680283 RepID=A0A918VWF9_9FLAO|nr:TonB-dependent receptor [Salinimicrobium marinum]GHA31291.1 TonB-dependent receptor [Salinimicrobium marinum]